LLTKISITAFICVQKFTVIRIQKLIYLFIAISQVWNITNS
jgi:hypothetical protein